MNLIRIPFHLIDDIPLIFLKCSAILLAPCQLLSNLRHLFCIPYPMRKILLILSIFTLEACVSGKTALKHGDYYDAVLESVNRLRASPENKKAKAVLQEGYPLEIEYVDSNIKNGMDSDDPKKWRNAVKGYEQINYINSQISTSMGAKRVISKPITRFTELKEAKLKAAEESYKAGITALMKNTRNDSKEAYFDFKAANDYEPGYSESIEMMTQAEFNATLRVAYEEINASRTNYGSLQPVINSLQRQFLSFKPITQKDTVPPHQYLRITFNGFQSDLQPQLTTSSENISRDIKVGEKKGADGKTQDVMQNVTARVTYFHKYKRAASNATFIITEVQSNAVLLEENIIGDASWQYDWATFSGDARALSGSQQSLVNRKEAFPNNQDIFNQSIRNLENNLGRQLQNFYSSY